MTTTLKSVLERVVDKLQDTTSTTWSLQKLVRYLNDGQRTIHLHRPDLFDVEAELVLVAGAKQALPAAGSKLINITHNTVGRMASLTRIPRQLLDAQVPGWRSMTPAIEVQHFMYDERQPKVFEVYPPAKVGAKLQVEYASIPVDLAIPGANTLLAALSGDVNVPDLQATALQHYILFACFAEDGEDGNTARAQGFYALFNSELGIEVTATTAVAPTTASN